MKNARAISAALDCTIPEMREAAIRVIDRALRRTGGNRTQAADDLEVSYDRFFLWVSKLPELKAKYPGISGPPEKRSKKG